MKKFALFFITLTFLISCSTSKKIVIQPQSSAPPTDIKKVYRYSIDLLNINNDKVSVSLIPPKSNLEKAKFVIPKLVPGYYAAMDFGQYISNFKAVDKKGQPVKVEKLDKNSWLIHDFKNVDEITYDVDDSWDQLYEKHHTAKSPATMYDKNDVIVLNYNSVAGYFEEEKEAIYRVDIKKPANFYGSSAIKPFKLDDTSDIISTFSYRELVDAPVMYCEPDTAWLNIGKTKILVSLYSKSEKQFAKTIASKIENLLQNQALYLGGELPVKDYAFLIYHETAPAGNFLGDGLEHNNSTLCLFAVDKLTSLHDYIFDIASHEFFHIITPLNIHSKEIQNYDYLNPIMSKHLWLYEGMTEYATIHMPIKQKMIGLNDFAKKIEEKVNNMARFDDKLPFTELSKKALERQDQYMNVYQKGPVIGLCLDIKLRELSAGKMGTQELTQALVKKYGKDAAFNDDELFDVITQMTFPEIRTFFKDYVENSKPLPLKESLEKAGFELNEKTKTVILSKNPTEKQLILRGYWLGQ